MLISNEIMMPKIQYQFLFFLIIISVTSAEGKNLNNKGNELRKNDSEQVTYGPPRENLKLSFNDTIINSKSYYFSNPNTKDLFVLIVRPGLVKNSKAEFRILSVDRTVIYSQVFDSFALIMRIFEPDTIPKGGQAVYEAYMEKYWRSLTLSQYEAYFKKNVQKFFDNNVLFINKTEFKKMCEWANVVDHETANEAFSDSRAILMSLSCFFCDGGGGSVLYFSKKKGKVMDILDHD